MRSDSFLSTFQKEVVMPMLKFLRFDQLFKTSDKVAVLPLKGVIGGHSVPGGSEHFDFDDTKELIDQAFALRGIKAVALAINSPGGSPVQSSRIQLYIDALSKEHDIPVYSFCEDVAASGGYWLACIGEEIYADHSSIIGSIGVIAAGFGFTDLIKKYGVERRVYAQGENKAMLDPFMPEKEEDVERLLNAQKDVHDAFKAYVKERRAEKLDIENKDLFTGAFFSGASAKALGLVDDIGHLEPVMKEKLGKDIVFVRLEEEKGFVQKLIGMQSARAGNIAAAVVARIEARLQWARFGL